MIRDRSAPESSSLGIDLTPLLDIIFIVLVFLLLTANVRIQSMDITLPEVADSTQPAQTVSESLTLHLFADAPYWALGEQKFTDWDAFSNAILTARAQPHTTGAQPEIIIAADRDASTERLLNLLNFLQRQNIPAAQILTKGSE